MKKKWLLLLLFILSSLFISCGKVEQKSKALIKFTAGASAVATQTGGVLVFGRKLNGPGMFSLPLNHELDTEEINLPYGQWQIAAIAWGGASKLSGNVKCGSNGPQGTTVNKDSITISLTLSDDNCAQFVFGDAASKETVGGDVNQFKQLGFFTCTNKDKVNANPANTSHCSTAEDTGTGKSFYFSYKRAQPGLGLAPSTKLKSQCITGISSGYKDSGLRIPFIDSIAPVPFEVVMYPKANCTGTPEYFHFDQGITSPIIDKAKTYVGGAGNFAVLRSNICASYDETLAFATGAFVISGTNYICDVDHFNNIAAKISDLTSATKFVQLRDLNFSDVELQQVGTSTDNFISHYDGRNFKIKNVIFEPTCSAASMNGLFNYVKANSPATTIKNLVLENIQISKTDSSNCDYVAPIANVELADNYSVELENIKVINSIFKGEDYVGGLVAKVHTTSSNAKLTLKDIHVDANVEGRNQVGGIVGSSDLPNNTSKLSVENSEFIGNIVGSSRVGGIIGYSKYGHFSNVVAKPDSGNLITLKFEAGTPDDFNFDIGGIIGYSHSNKIFRSKAIGNIQVDSGSQSNTFSNVGGIVGTDSADTNGENLITHTIYKGLIKLDGESVGGIAGIFTNPNSKIESSHTSGSIDFYNANAGNDSRGGVVGQLQGWLKNSASYMDVKGEDYVGGLVGHLNGTVAPTNSTGWSGVILNSYAKNGIINGNNTVGGLVGYSKGIVKDAYADITLTSNGSNPQYFAGAVGKLEHIPSCASFTIYSSSSGNFISNNGTGGSGPCLKPEISNIVVKDIGVVSDFTSITSNNSTLKGSANLGEYVILGANSNTEISNIRYIDPGTLFVEDEITTATNIIHAAEFTIANINCSELPPALNSGNFFCNHVITPKKLELRTAYGAGFFDSTGNIPEIIDISTEGKLKIIRDNPVLMGAHFRLTSNLTVTGTSGFTNNMIGSQLNPFVGYFEPNGYSITNLIIDDVDAKDVGMFRVAGTQDLPAEIGSIDDPLVFYDSDVNGAQRVGTVVGELKNGFISAKVYNGLVSINQSSHSSLNDFGGLVGRLGGNTGKGRIENSYFQGDISAAGVSGVGGLVGYLVNGDIEHSSVNVDISEALVDVGGIAGVVEAQNQQVIINDVHANNKDAASNMIAGVTGDSGVANVGGLVGRVDDDGQGLGVYESSNKGSIVLSGPNRENIGGLIGMVAENSTINSCFVSGVSIQGNNRVGGFVGSTDLGNINIQNSYIANSTVTSTGASSNAAGMIGFDTINSNSITQSFVYNTTVTADTTTNDINDVYDSSGNQSPYTNTASMSGVVNSTSWANPMYWKTDSRGYPKLIWEP